MDDKKEKQKVLIVDDTPANIHVLMEILKEQYIVSAAVNGERALKLAAMDLPDIILLDIMMPIMDGYEVCAKLKADPATANIPVIFITALTSDESEAKGLELGALDYIAKPFNPSLVRVRVQNQLELKKYRDRLEEMVETRTKELLLTNAAMEKFVPRELMCHLGVDNLAHIRFGDCIKKEVTVLFSDIRSFTTLSEDMTPQKTFDFLNSYFKLMGPIIRKHSGFINKFIGDGIMAIFTERPEDAINAAIEMLEAIKNLGHELIKLNNKNIDIGIGIHTGRVILGTVGERDRMEATVIGDAVNVASRLEGMTKNFRTPILISTHTYDLIEERENYLVRYLGPLEVRGKIMHIPILEVYNTDSPEIRDNKQNLKDKFHQAVLSFQEGDRIKALTLFEECQSVNPDDRVTAYYLNKCTDKMSD